MPSYEAKIYLLNTFPSSPPFSFPAFSMTSCLSVSAALSLTSSNNPDCKSFLFPFCFHTIPKSVNCPAILAFAPQSPKVVQARFIVSTQGRSNTSQLSTHFLFFKISSSNLTICFEFPKPHTDFAFPSFQNSNPGGNRGRQISPPFNIPLLLLP